MLKRRDLRFLFFTISEWEDSDIPYFRNLMKNPYSLDPPNPLIGLIADNVVCCLKRNEEVVKRCLATKDPEAVLFTIEDDMEEEQTRMIAWLNSHRLERDGHNINAHENGRVQLKPDEDEKAHYTTSIDPETGDSQKFLLLAAEECDKGGSTVIAEVIAALAVT